MSVEDSESRRFELRFGLVFLRPILAQDRPRNVVFVFFLCLERFYRRFVLTTSGTEILWILWQVSSIGFLTKYA